MRTGWKAPTISTEVVDWKSQFGEDIRLEQFQLTIFLELRMTLALMSPLNSLGAVVATRLQSTLRAHPLQAKTDSVCFSTNDDSWGCSNERNIMFVFVVLCQAFRGLNSEYRPGNGTSATRQLAGRHGLCTDCNKDKNWRKLCYYQLIEADDLPLWSVLAQTSLRQETAWHGPDARSFSSSFTSQASPSELQDVSPRCRCLNHHAVFLSSK